MGKVFQVFFERIQSATPIKNQQGLAEALGVNRSAITQAKNLDRIPQKWVLQLSRRFGLAADWIEYGIGEPRPGKAAIREEAPRTDFLPGSEVFVRRNFGLRRPSARSSGHPTGSGDAAFSETPHAQTLSTGTEHSFLFRQVPKVAARLSAGGGSFEAESQVLGTRAFDLSWLRRMGNPAEMVLMDVVGDSMAPGICDGDTVLVDRSQADLVFGSVYAVGHGDTVLVKRIRRAQNGLALISDNPEYSPVLLRGDDMESFRIIGRVVWLCREC